MLRPRDTSVDADRRQLEGYRSMTPAQRLGLAAELTAEVRRLTAAGIRQRHPDWSEDRQAAELARILVGYDGALTAGRGPMAGS